LLDVTIPTEVASTKLLEAQVMFALNNFPLLPQLVAVIVVHLAYSCSAPDPKEVRSSSVSAASYVECNSTSQLAVNKNLNLAAGHDPSDEYLMTSEAPDYYDTIKTIIDTNCAMSGCHVAGGTSPDLSTYALVKTNMTRSKIRMDLASNPMPPGNQLSSGDRALFSSWITAGAPEKDDENEMITSNEKPSSAPDTSPTDSISTTSESPTACFVKNESRVEIEDADFDYLLRSSEVSDCHNKKLIYDRNTKTCGKATLNLEWCNRIGILKKFADADKDVLSIVNKALGDGTSETDIGDGFIIDQCGIEPSKAPIVVFMRLVKPPEVPGLKVRVLTIDTTKKNKAATTTETSQE